SPGPADESAQTVSFEITNNTNTSLFSVAPAVSSGGNLTYTLAADAFGSATITLRAHDTGGTANGGVDSSPTQSFTITINPVNDPPVVTNKTATAQANMTLSISGLLNGVSDADAGVNGCTPTPFAVASVGATSPAGGSVMITDAANGVVDFDPPAGVTGAVTFTYTVSDSGCPGT